MINFVLKKHKVEKAFFAENKEYERKNNVEIGVEGSVLVPKEIKDNNYAMIQLKFHVGKPDERLYLALDTVSTFEINEYDTKTKINEDIVRKKCIPIALTELRKTVKNVTEAYGLPALELPPFEDEIVNE